MVEDTGEIFNAPSDPRPPTPYFLVYVEEDLKTQLVDPVCRKVTTTTEEPMDITGEDYEPIPLDDFPTQIHKWPASAPDRVSLRTTNGSWDQTGMEGGGW